MKNKIFSMLLVLSTWCRSAPDTTLLSNLLVLDQKEVQGMPVQQQPAAPLPQTRATLNLNASYTITNQWPTGYDVTIQLGNPNSTPTSSWAVTFTLPPEEKIFSSSNGNFTTQGSNVLVVNTDASTGIIAPYGTLSFNFLVMRLTSGAAQISNLNATGTGNAPTITVPAVPQLNAIAIALNSSNYIVSWNSSANATSYILQQSTSSSFTNPTTWAQTITYKSFINQPDGAYYYRVSASNTVGISDWSGIQSVIVNVLSGILPAPVLQAISNPSGSASYTVSWTAVPAAQGYILQQATTSDFSNATTIFNGTATQTTVTVNPEATYYYRVNAYNGSLNSASSNVVSYCNICFSNLKESL